LVREGQDKPNIKNSNKNGREENEEGEADQRCDAMGEKSNVYQRKENEGITELEKGDV